MTSNNQNIPTMESPIDDSKLKDQQIDGLTRQASATTTDNPEFGWSGYAERINGRFAMIGFLAILLIELLSKDSFLHWSGILPL